MADLALTWDEGKADFLKQLGNLVQYFQVNCPSNGNSLPMKLIDPTVLMPGLLDYRDPDEVPDNIVYNAMLHVDYDEGYPTVDGLPLWERLDGELVEYYKLFKEYREMKYVGGSRSIAKLSASSTVSGRHLNHLAKVYHWQTRCRAYDMFKDQLRLAQRQYDIDKLETTHSKNATILMERAMEWLERHPEQLNPKVALQMVQLGMKAGRLALGLHPERPGTGEEGGGSRGTTINIQQNNATDNGTINAPQVDLRSDEDANHLQSILHVLDQSGAFDTLRKDATDDDEIIDVDAEVVE